MTWAVFLAVMEGLNVGYDVGSFVGGLLVGFEVGSFVGNEVDVVVLALVI